MGIIFGRKRIKHRRFDYQPKYYNPEEEKKLRERIRMRTRANRRKSPMGIVYALVLLTFAVYLYQNLM